MDFPRSHAAFEQGYLAACAGEPRQVPEALTTRYPVLSREWLMGYDDAAGDSEEVRTWMVAGFGERLAA